MAATICIERFSMPNSVMRLGFEVKRKEMPEELY